jgi:hypothetical protein
MFGDSITSALDKATTDLRATCLAGAETTMEAKATISHTNEEDDDASATDSAVEADNVDTSSTISCSSASIKQLRPSRFEDVDFTLGTYIYPTWKDFWELDHLTREERARVIFERGWYITAEEKEDAEARRKTAWEQKCKESAKESAERWAKVKEELRARDLRHEGWCDPWCVKDDEDADEEARRRFTWAQKHEEYAEWRAKEEEKGMELRPTGWCDRWCVKDDSQEVEDEQTRMNTAWEQKCKEYAEWRAKEEEKGMELRPKGWCDRWCVGVTRTMRIEATL